MQCQDSNARRPGEKHGSFHSAMPLLTARWPQTIPLKTAHVHDLLEAEKASLSVVINLIADYP